jgi:pimeloyl-ACP methyl ester carboxylesterase
MEFPEQITIGYVFFAFAYCAGLGFWQIVAARQGLRALSWVPRRANHRWGYLAGSALLALACVWFFGTRTEDIFCPGPASSEFLFFLACALLAAMVTSMLLSSLVGRLVPAREDAAVRGDARTEDVRATWWNGTLHLPVSEGSPWPAVCLVPDTGSEVESLGSMAARLGRKKVSALVLDMDSADTWQYPDVLASIPQALAYLERNDEVDAERLGLLGVGLGGDLAIRAAASDPQVRAVVAIAPLLSSFSLQPSLDLLREMSYLEAIRWRRRHNSGKVVAQLDALNYMPEFGDRPLLIVYGEEDRLSAEWTATSFPRSVKINKVPGLGRAGLVRDPQVVSFTVSWLLRHLEGSS